MDIATLIGIFAGLICIGYGLASGGSPRAFWDLPSLFIVLGGGLASTLISYRLGEIAKISKVVANAFTHRQDSVFVTMEFLLHLANKARQEGLLSLEPEIEQMNDAFLKNPLELVIDGDEPESIRDSMLAELDSLKARHAKGQALFKTLGSMFPAWGMIGTLIGLINLLRSLDDPSKIGPAMAVALVTTFYGSILANFICLPIANKLAIKSKEEIQLKEMILEAVLALESGSNPRMIEKKMLNFLSPSQKAEYQKWKERPRPEQSSSAVGDTVAAE
ncbi:chemotaxis protein MotA [Hydrogenispora ethanolica]|jgi:chemotaxis protein MotA|uniref:Chemotaxis protein MotA n=1 Tax=Hydrogenispora ethanolica TaxID=1082276 RepID=A0A4R1SDR3_HYDET|nr:motility protein A [Hydrogenispora ethanolica]TCL76792.1 chemotaxis protein MotA [Hydrogenispora ethanolica]